MRAKLILATIVISVLMPTASAFAQYPPIVRGNTTHNSTPKDRVLPNRITQEAPLQATDQVLPLTGGDVTLLVVAGMVMVIVGATLVRRTRGRAIS